MNANRRRAKMPTKMPRRVGAHNVMMVLLAAILLIAATNIEATVGLKIDNQLLSAKNDCFERLVLEAMIPFERTFRVVETNVIRECENLCKAEADRCQSFALGIAPKGNGTCQLSSIRIDPTTGRRPAGTVYDPDFDIYQRQLNCGINEPVGKPVIGLSPTGSTFSTPSNGVSSDSTTLFASTPSGRPSSSSPMTPPSPTISTSYTTVMRPKVTTDTRPVSNNPADPNFSTRYPSDHRYGTTERYPSTDLETRYPQNQYNTRYGSSESSASTIHLINDREPVSTTDQLHFYHELRPTYSYPMLYEKNYPLPNDKFIGFNTYAQNVPTVASDIYRPTSSSSSAASVPATSSYGATGSNNGNSIGASYPNQYGSTSTVDDHHPNYRPSATAAGYDRDRPTQLNHTGMGYQPATLATHFIDRPTGGYLYSNGNGYSTGGTSSGYGSNNIRPVQDSMPCFRRVLAGKRVSQQWVRRTMTCERVDDCQAECGLEKRFTCEGFNYRIDPSGRGRGVCELIDVPLAQMDVYSSGNNRDENLIYHPDTDYYERDRNTCRPSPCTNCVQTYGSGPPSAPSGSDYIRPTTYRPPDFYKPSSHYDDQQYPSRPSSYGSSSPTFNDPPPFNSRPTHYDNRPPPSTYDHHSRPPSSSDSRPPDYDRYDVADDRPPSYSSSPSYRPPSGPSYGSDLDRYDQFRPVYEDTFHSTSDHRYGPKDPPPPYKDHYSRPDFIPIEQYRPQHHRPSSPSAVSDNSYLPNTRPSTNFHHGPPTRYPSQPSAHIDDNGGGSNLPHSIYLDRDPPAADTPLPPRRKPSGGGAQQFPFVPYSIGEDMSWGSYGGSYGGSSYSKYSSNYWGLRNNEIKRKDDQRVNYHSGWSGGNDGGGVGVGGADHVGGSIIGGSQTLLYNDNDVWAYGNHRQKVGGGPGSGDLQTYERPGQSWTRRPGQDECSVKSSQGFRLHKGIVRYAHKAPTVTECERMCHSENSFRCVTYSFRYNTQLNDNCLLCDRPINLLDYYADLEPDRDYDIYAMSDDPMMCQQQLPAARERQNAAQCFFRAIDTSRFFKSIVRDSLLVRSVGECEMECIKSAKFTCRAFSYRYGPKTPGGGGVIDNCQLSDWPVLDLLPDRHLVADASFDVYERASYGHGCEIQPIVDDKHKKLCYLGYGSPAKLLSVAIKKVVSAASELECKKECIRFRENTPFKCFSFSYGSQASTFNCELSDLDQTELKVNVHYAHTTERGDYWLFAWNPFDWTCRDKVNTIGGGGGAGADGVNRVNNDRRMDVFREQGGHNTWTHFTVSGKACRIGSACEMNVVTGFYSCELEGAEIGAWDYCCKSDHPCGYSNGFEYPWCFVGDKRDQWRKCSDRYFPGQTTHHSKSPISNSLTFSASNDHVVKKVVRPPASLAAASGHRGGQTPPRPGGLEDVAAARLWPVTYLYSSGPPNATELSNYVDCNKESC